MPYLFPFALLAACAFALSCNPFTDVGSQCDDATDCPRDAICHDWDCDGVPERELKFCTIRCATNQDCFDRYDLAGGDHVFCGATRSGDQVCTTRGSCG